VTFVEHVDDVLRHALLPSPATSRLVDRPRDERPGLPGIAH
jgi:hypothetical protein